MTDSSKLSPERPSSLRERTMSLIVDNARKNEIDTTDATLFLNGDSVLPVSREGRLFRTILQHGADHLAAQIILGIGDSLVAKNMIQGPIAHTDEVFRQAANPIGEGVTHG